jgi:hypothetical protein
MPANIRSTEGQPTICTVLALKTASTGPTGQSASSTSRAMGARTLASPASSSQGLDTGVVDRQFAGAPGQVRQRRAEMDGVLAGAAGDLQDLAAVGESFMQYGEDRLAVLLAGFSKGFHGVIPPESMVTGAAGALQQEGYSPCTPGFSGAFSECG